MQKPILLVIPSLINRGYVLDLMPEHSFLRTLAHTTRPLLVDWGTPGIEETTFASAEYLSQRLQPIVHYITHTLAPGQPVIIAGYCMGGLLAMALCQREPALCKGLVLLATPWDFQALQPPPPALDAEQKDMLRTIIRSQPVFPALAIQSLFYLTSPWLFPSKFTRLARMDQASPEAAMFVAIEDWVNDGIDLAGPLASECLIDWGMDNLPCRGQWKVGDSPLSPTRLTIPSIAVIPGKDRVVPPACAEPLAAALPQCEVLRPVTGHVGIMAGAHTAEHVWQPIMAWVGQHFGLRATTKPL